MSETDGGADPRTQRGRRARAEVARQLADAPGLVGVGVGATAGGEPEVLVLVEAAGCEAARRAPRECEGCRVQVEVSGKPSRQ